MYIVFISVVDYLRKEQNGFQIMLFTNNKSVEALLYDVHIFLIKPITIKNYTIFFLQN